MSLGCVTEGTGTCRVSGRHTEEVPCPFVESGGGGGGGGWVGHHYGDSIGEISLFTVIHTIVHEGGLSEWVQHRGLREGGRERGKEGERGGRRKGEEEGKGLTQKVYQKLSVCFSTCHVTLSCVELTAVTFTPVGFPGAGRGGGGGGGGGERRRGGRKGGRAKLIMRVIPSNATPTHKEARSRQ